MNNIYTEIETMLSPEHISDEYEISELVYAPVLAIVEEDGIVTTHSDTLSPELQKMIVSQYKFDELLPTIDGVDLTILGYVVGREFFVFSVWQRGEGAEMSPKRRASFMELYNMNALGVRLRHVPVFPTVLKLDGAKRAIENGKSKMSDIQKYTIKAVVELASGISPMTKMPRKGIVLKSTTQDYAVKVYSEDCLQMMGSV